MIEFLKNIFNIKLNHIKCGKDFIAKMEFSIYLFFDTVFGKRINDFFPIMNFSKRLNRGTPYNIPRDVLRNAQKDG